MDEYYSKTDLLHFIRVKTRFLDDAIIGNEGDSARIKGYAHAFEQFENALTESCDDEIPKADVQPVKHGRWIWDSNAPHREHGAYKCSNCGCHSDFEKNYCYNCGARMIKDGDTE